jgi:hypothetical protein
MRNSSLRNYNVSITTDSINESYTFNVWANDSVGNSNSSINQTFDSFWDCTWNMSSVSGSDLGQFFGFDIKRILLILQFIIRVMFFILIIAV